MANVVKRSVDIRYGQEGPRHDPYGYVEYEIYQEFDTVPPVFITVHIGLVEYAEINGRRVDIDSDSFSCIATMDVRTFCSLVERAKARRITVCRKCGSRKLEQARGYPGEIIVYCSECGSVCDSEISYMDM